MPLEHNLPQLQMPAAEHLKVSCVQDSLKQNERPLGSTGFQYLFAHAAIPRLVSQPQGHLLSLTHPFRKSQLHHTQ